jgi:hypothetical protein
MKLFSDEQIITLLKEYSILHKTDKETGLIVMMDLKGFKQIISNLILS